MPYKWRFYNSIFNLERGARQGDLISAYLFILALEVLFELIKNNAAFVDDSTFFLDDLLSVKNLIDTFKEFSLFSGLKANFSKCEIAGLDSVKGVLEAVCGLKSINHFWNSRMLSLKGRIIIFKTLAISKIFILHF